MVWLSNSFPHQYINVVDLDEFLRGVSCREYVIMIVLRALPFCRIVNQRVVPYPISPEWEYTMDNFGLCDLSLIVRCFDAGVASQLACGLVQSVTKRKDQQYDYADHDGVA